jgi:squalene-hopene/tetraprenyl-beta-curcumene cyclase
MIDRARLDRAYLVARDALLAERRPGGYWEGELSTSALSTAVAVSALAKVGGHAALIEGGLKWLAEHQNDDGGWGDTTRSFSNISTTLLCCAAFHITGRSGDYTPTLERCAAWLAARYGRTPAEIAEAVRRRYGKDRTFSVPILMTCALAGLVEWREVPSLPFELACFPQTMYRFLGLPVVSYALPALIAIGQAVFHHRRPWNPAARVVRKLAINPTLAVLEKIQPSNGGFLEATPLTSFVALGLASTGRAEHPVVRKCVEFIVASVRPDGSWPIDTNLSTWVTTLAVNVLAAAKDLEALGDKELLVRWLVEQQYKERHPFTGADPGGWGWTPLPGAVPDADDTPGVMLALCHLHAGNDVWPRWGHARNWLLELQNRDGGVPTFCRGWSNLPFDRSGSDLTAHAIRALQRLSLDEGHFPYNVGEAIDLALAYLAKQQRPDGSWLPLWFGNQHAPDDINPTYGTSRVLAAYRDLGLMGTEQARRGVAFLLSIQNADGGWGGAKDTPSSVEETALALDALLGEPGASAPGGGGTRTALPPGANAPGSPDAVARGLAWLIDAVEAGRLHQPTPIGFYFAKLWYFEKMYPIVWSVMALGRARHS